MLRYLQYRDDNLDCVWLTRHGARLSCEGIARDFQRLFKWAGIEGVKDKAHAFRRTWAANAERQGVERQYILSVGGWNDAAMLDHYTRQMREEEGAVDAFRDFKPFAR